MLVCLYKKLLGLVSPKQTQRPSIRGLWAGSLVRIRGKLFQRGKVTLSRPIGGSAAKNLPLTRTSEPLLAGYQYVPHYEFYPWPSYKSSPKSPEEVLCWRNQSTNEKKNKTQSHLTGKAICNRGPVYTRIRIFRIQKLFLPIQKYLRTHVSFSNHFRSSTKRILFRLKMEIFF